MAVASGVADITKYLLEIGVDADHKTKMGKGDSAAREGLRRPNRELLSVLETLSKRQER